jgi:pimeloyl-ACP methyl ester carboxylesterase
MNQLDTGRAQPLRFDTTVGRVAALACGSGRPVLLLPGFTGSKEDFGPIQDELAAAGFRAVAIDLLGQFESDPADPDEPAGYSPVALGAVVRAVADRLGDGVHLLGHSFGGLVARAAVLAGGRFASLVLLDSGPAALSGARAERIELMRPLLPQLGVAGVYEASEALRAGEPGYVPDPPELAAFLRRRFVAGSAAGLLGMGAALLAEPDQTAELAAAGLPVRVVFGADDDAWPAAVQRRMAAQLSAGVDEIPHAAHSPAVENPAATARALIDFWRRVP